MLGGGGLQAGSSSEEAGVEMRCRLRTADVSLVSDCYLSLLTLPRATRTDAHLRHSHSPFVRQDSRKQPAGKSMATLGGWCFRATAAAAAAAALAVSIRAPEPCACLCLYLNPVQKLRTHAGDEGRNRRFKKQEGAGKGGEGQLRPLQLILFIIKQSRRVPKTRS